MVLHDLNLACRYADHLVAMGTVDDRRRGPTDRNRRRRLGRQRLRAAVPRDPRPADRDTDGRAGADAPPWRGPPAIQPATEHRHVVDCLDRPSVLGLGAT